MEKRGGNEGLIQTNYVRTTILALIVIYRIA